MPEDNTPTLAGRPFDPAVLRKSRVLLAVETEYPAQFQPGMTLHSDSGFILGTVTVAEES